MLSYTRGIWVDCMPDVQRIGDSTIYILCSAYEFAAAPHPGHEFEAFFTPQQKNNPQNLGIFGLASTFHNQKRCKFPFRVQVQGGVAANYLIYIMQTTIGPILTRKKQELGRKQNVKTPLKFLRRFLRTLFHSSCFYKLNLRVKNVKNLKF